MLRRSLALVAGGTAAALVTATGVYSTLALLAPLPGIDGRALERVSVSTPAATVALPGYGASAIGPLDEAGTVYAGVDLDTVRPIASITKVVTALVVLEQAPLAAGESGPTITLDTAAGRLDEEYRARNGSVAPAEAGLQLTQRQLIDLMLVWSANNYADTLAIWAFGSTENYLAAAAEYLDRHGIENLQVADATGFSPDSAGTPRALLELARLAAAHPVVAESAAQEVIDVPGVGRFENRNLALGRDGVTGLKTGTTEEAGACLLFSGRAQIDGETVDVVGVVLDAEVQSQAAADARALLTSVVDDYRLVTVAEPGEPVARWRAPWGDEVELRTAEGASELVWGDATSQSFVPTPELRAGFPAPDAPAMAVQLGDEQLEVPLQWSGAIEGPDLAWRLLRPLREAGILTE
ncbi:D-alanyl-D-alanine carboxypeptidase family protein [Microcella alkalica]|uniref:D-alanyl-D-alanine carboxypeptidase family protein n=1 Tax=Microcella alkalica TaxID=355930 RepID=UPI00145CC3A2|nr:D-alanyl-D-alanine carboxypeptidase [Microcella alkalica]